MKFGFLIKILQYIGLISFPIILCLFLMEIVLRTGKFDGEDNPAPVWIPERFKAINRQITAQNREIAKHNTFGFNDRERSRHKTPQRSRIAILGDSFVWGGGVPYDVIWSHKFEKLLNDRFPNIEVLSWGISGWSTLDELNFLKTHGKDYEIDLLIVDFTTNDPDLGNYPQQYLNFGKSLWFAPVKKLFPLSSQFIRSYVNNVYERYFTKDLGYFNWENKLYEKDNLERYAKVLSDFSQACRNLNIDVLFVLTPNNYHHIFREKFDKIIPMLTESHLPYLDLYPAVYQKLHHLPYRKLWANLADAHPGDMVTEIYKDEVFSFLDTSGTLKLLNEKYKR